MFLAAVILGSLTVANVISPFLAEGDSDFAKYLPLSNAVGLAGVLGWFMFRLEPRVRSMESTIDRASRVAMIQVLAIDELSQGLRNAAKDRIEEIDLETVARRKEQEK